MTTNDTPIEALLNTLAAGESVSLTLNLSVAADGKGVAFSGEVSPPQQATPILVPPLLSLPIQVPPVVAPIVPPPTIPTVATIVASSEAPQFAVVTHPIPIPGTLKTPFPHPTNTWWENIILGKNRIAPEPYQVQVVDNGFTLCYPTQSFVQDSFGMQHITTQFLQNLSLEFAEVMGSWGVTKYDDLTVTLQWIASNGQSATAVLAQGCPYLSMAYASTTPLLTSQHLILSVNGMAPTGTYTGNKFKIALNNGQTWLVYCSNAVTFMVSANQLQATTPFTGIVRVAVLSTPSDEAILDQYVVTIPTGGTMTTQQSTNAMAYLFNWTVVGSGQLLMCALPHHMDILSTPQTVPLHYQSMKGMTTGVVGNSWTLIEPFPTIQWTAPRPIASAYHDAIVAQLKKDATFVNTSTSDTYFAGKGLAKMARLLLIANEVGDTDSASTLQANLKASLTTWFTQNGLFAYEQKWGGMVFAPALGDIGSDFGFSYSWNDHHFHLGYFAYACAVLGKFDPTWLATYQERVTELVHDYCNPLGSSDTRYPEVRNKDFYAGHSWASGLVDFADNRNQESTSEAVNGYYGAALWGAVIGDTTLQNVALLMLAMEARSTKKYWHVYNGNNVYGTQWTANGVGIVWSAKIDDSTWFDAHLSCRRGIHAIPLTPITELLLEPSWVQAMQASGEMAKMQSENFTIWPSFVNGLLAVVDKVTAWNNIMAMTDAQIDDGASRTSLMYWVATRP